MKFGIFDHCERKPQPPSVTFGERIRLAKRAEQAGFHAYHVAEHHGTPLSQIPSPGLFLAALAQHTTTLRLGALVYLLPLYDPYRLAQEVCMLDALSNGRVELGIGRGANPVELGFFGLTPETAKARFDEAYQALMQGLTEGRIHFEGRHYSIPNAPLDTRPVQVPYPPIWYPTSNAAGSLTWAAKQGFNTVVNGRLEPIIEAVQAYKDNFVPGPHGADPMIGLTRYVFVAESDAEALRVGEPAFRYHLDNLARLAREAGQAQAIARVMPPADLAEAVKEGWAVAGSPDTVRAQMAALFDRVGNNYFLFAPMMADLSLEWGLRTIELFESEIMPAFQAPALADQRRPFAGPAGSP